MNSMRFSLVLLMGLFFGLFTVLPATDVLDVTYDETDSQPLESTVPFSAAVVQPLVAAHPILQTCVDACNRDEFLLLRKPSRTAPLSILDRALRC